MKKHYLLFVLALIMSGITGLKAKSYGNQSGTHSQKKNVMTAPVIINKNNFSRVLGIKDPSGDNRNLRTAAVQLDSTYHWVWDAGGAAWNAQDKYLYTYDANGNETESIGFVWLDFVQLWLYNDRNTSTYDINGNLVSYVTELWDGTMWVPQSRNLYTYNSQQLLIEQVFEFWDDVMSMWSPVGKYLTAYDSNNLEIQFTLLSWNSSLMQYENTQNLILYWSGANQLDSILFQVSFGGPWENSSMDCYFYSAPGVLDTYLFKVWNGTDFIDVSRELYTYNASNDNISTDRQDWDGFTWNPSGMFNYTYDNNHNQLSSEYLYWNGGGWDIIERRFFTYDGMDNWISEVLQLDDGFGNYMNSDSTHYYYNTSVGIDQNTLSKFRVNLYPNPASDYLNIELAGDNANAQLEGQKISIVDVFGRTLIIREFQRQVNLKDLAPGLYRIRIGDSKSLNSFVKLKN